VGAIHKLASNIVKVSGPGMHADGGGLFLQVKGTAKSWLFRYTSPLTGKRRETGLGSALTLSLTAARQKAQDLRVIVANGKDPLQPEAEAQPQGRSLAQVFDSYYEANAPGWKNAKHRQQWQNSLGTHAADILKMRAAEIERADIVKALTPIWTVKPETARRVRGRLEMLLDFAVAHGDRPEGVNPAALSIVRHGLPRQRQVVTNFASVEPDDAPSVFQSIWARRHEGQGAAALSLLILGAFRPGEVRGLRWTDLREDHIEIEAARMKAGRRHRVPITDAMAEVLDREKLAETVFFGKDGKPLSDATLSAVHKRLGIDATCHGWRSTFRRWAHSAGWSRDLSEDALAHTLAQTDAEAAYLRDADLLDQRRDMMAAWSAYLFG